MNSIFSLIGIAVIILIVILLIVTNIRVVPQTEAYIMERLGNYHVTWTAGLSIKMPFVDRIVMKVSTKEQLLDTSPQPVITKDNVTLTVDGVVYYKITDPKAYCYGINNPGSAIENLTATTLRNIMGDMELDETLTSRDVINSQMRSALDVATDPWGIKVMRVELKNIMPPAEIQDAMERQMKAERTRRESILRAEGEKKAAILTAEGEKESRILRAEADKQEIILKAEGDREYKLKVAEGEAAAIKTVAAAKKISFELLNQSPPREEILKLMAYETFEAVSKGEANKIIIPTDLASSVGTLSALVESVK